MSRPRRAQANLIALGVALLLVTAAVGVALAVAAGAFADAERDPAERRLASGLSDRIVVAPDGPVARAPNVLPRRSLDGLTASSVEDSVPALQGRAFRVRLDGTTVAERGNPSDGTTVRRLVLVESRRATDRTVGLDGNETTVQLSDRTDRVDVNLTGTNGTVSGLRLDERVVRQNASGLIGNETLRPARDDPPTLSFVAADPPSTAAARLTTYPWTAREATLEVTVDA